MKPTLPFVKERFDEFNRKVFGGRLPDLPIRLSDASTFLGMCVAKIRRLPDGSTRHSDFELRISLRHDISREELEDVILHEMIHYFIMYNELPDTSPHGEIFKGMMHSINKSLGRNISVSRRSTHEEHAETRGSKKLWHVIAAIYFHDGRHGVKVLPRVVPKILDYYNKVAGMGEVREVRLFLHDNPFFNRFPTSAALKIYAIEGTILESNLEGARKLIPQNGKLIQR